MPRPHSVKSDNFFLLLFNALRQQRVPLVLRIVSHSLLLVSISLIIYAWVIGMQFKNAVDQQADAVGQSLVRQTVGSATGPLLANDKISLNVLLKGLVDNPLVAHAAIYSIDNSMLAEAGKRPKKALLGRDNGVYSAPITVQDSITGQLRIALDLEQFRQPLTISLQSMALLSLILLALTLYLSLRLGRNISTPLLQLRVWLRDPDDPAPGSTRQDEIGELARDLQSRLVEVVPEPELHISDDAFDDEVFDENLVDDDEPSLEVSKLSDPDLDEPEQDKDSPNGPPLTEEDDPFSELRPKEEQPIIAPAAPQMSHSALLAVQMGGQEQLKKLSRARLVSLLQRYRDCLEQVARVYQGKLHTLPDGSSLLLFDSRRSKDEYLTHALCSGELMRALGHALQVEVADSGIALELQLGLARGENLASLNQNELLLSDTAQHALALSRHSRNLLLVEGAIAEDSLVRQRAKIRSIARPEGACCVERLLDPYPSLLERQMARMLEQRSPA